MKLFVLTLLILGLTLTQSTPVAKKVEKRTAIESTKSDISPKFLNAKDDTDKFKPKTFKFEEDRIEKFIDDKKDEKVEEGKELMNEDIKDKLRPEDDSETLDVDREKKSCKTVKTPAPPPTKICLEISSAPGEVEICQDDPPPPPPPMELPPQPQISFEPQPVFEMPTEVICEQPQVIFVPPPPPPQPSTICFEALPPPPPQPSTICFETSPQQVMPQQPSVISVQPQMLQPQMIQPQMLQPQMIQPQMVQPQMIQPQMVQPQMFQPQMVQPQMIQIQPQFTQPQTIQVQPQFTQPQAIQFQPQKQFHKFQSHPPKKLYHKHGNANYVQPSAPVMQYPMQSQLATCTCQVAGGTGIGGVPVSPGTFTMNPTGPTAPGASVTISDNGLARHSGARFQAPMMNQPMMMNQGMTMRQPMMVQQQPMMVQQQPMMSARMSGLGQGMDVSLGPMSGQMRHVRGESGSPHELETEQNSHTQSSGKEEQSTQISLGQSSSSAPILRINTSPHQSSQNSFSQSNLMADNNNNMNEDNMNNIRNIDIQGPGMQPFSLGRSRQNLKDDALSNNGRFENMNGM